MITSLHEERIEAVLDVLTANHAHRVIDLGCGTGELVGRLVGLPQFERIVGIDTSIESLAQAQRELPPQEIVSGRVTLMYGSFTEGDPRQARFDAAVMLETIEHVPPKRLSAVERFVFFQIRPSLVLITTPNVEFNKCFDLGSRNARHPDHHFEWSRSRFEAWARGVALRNGFRVHFAPLGAGCVEIGGPSQMAIFNRTTAPGRLTEAMQGVQHA